MFLLVLSRVFSPTSSSNAQTYSASGVCRVPLCTRTLRARRLLPLSIAIDAADGPMLPIGIASSGLPRSISCARTSTAAARVRGSSLPASSQPLGRPRNVCSRASASPSHAQLVLWRAMCSCVSAGHPSSGRSERMKPARGTTSSSYHSLRTLEGRKSTRQPSAREREASCSCTRRVTQGEAREGEAAGGEEQSYARSRAIRWRKAHMTSFSRFVR